MPLEVRYDAGMKRTDIFYSRTEAIESLATQNFESTREMMEHAYLTPPSEDFKLFEAQQLL